VEHNYLGTFEEIVLLAVCVLGDAAYGVSVTDEINGQAGRPVHLSAVHTALYRLEEKGLLRSGLGGATPSRGGRRKRLYGVTPAGRHALREARTLRDGFWGRIPAVIWEGGAA
jgi:DNA-binding PadR family transcriptional regulator